MTAPGSNAGKDPPSRNAARLAGNEPAAHIDCTCGAAIVGRRASRILAEWSRRFGLTEPELQLVWHLRFAAACGADQKALAKALAFSPAQISTSVERLRVAGWVIARSAPGDRRRNHWQLSTAGQELIEQMTAAADSLQTVFEGQQSAVSLHAHGHSSQEAAA